MNLEGYPHKEIYGIVKYHTERLRNMAVGKTCDKDDMEFLYIQLHNAIDKAIKKRQLTWNTGEWINPSYHMQYGADNYILPTFHITYKHCQGEGKINARCFSITYAAWNNQDGLLTYRVHRMGGCPLRLRKFGEK